MAGMFKQRSSDTNAVHLAALAQHPPGAAGFDAVLLGDSYFERFLKPHLRQTPAGCWADAVGADFSTGAGRPDSPQPPALNGVFNAGVGGDRTTNCLWRLATGGLLDGLAAVGGTRAVLLCLGINDYTGTETVAAIVEQRDAFRAVLGELRRHPATASAAVVVLAIPPRKKRPEATRRDYNTFLRGLASGGRGPGHIEFVDPWAGMLSTPSAARGFTGGRGRPRPGAEPPATLRSTGGALLKKDGVHLTDKGCCEWAGAIRAILQGLGGVEARVGEDASQGTAPLLGHPGGDSDSDGGGGGGGDGGQGGGALADEVSAIQLLLADPSLPKARKKNLQRALKRKLVRSEARHLAS